MHVVLHERLVRFIPACAGNGPSAPSTSRRRPVHPRVCGERQCLRRRLRPGRGSSPRVRGTGRSVASGVQFMRFIPACAGNGVELRILLGIRSVHPRVCGERFNEGTRRYDQGGSSPRVRGTARRLRAVLVRPRFIPACAGNGVPPRSRETRPAVHPRVCGERTNSPTTHTTSNGSSPRVRGTDPGAVQPRRLQRFIPACAGNGEHPRAVVVVAPVHPRVCGERESEDDPYQLSTGSSPRVRGTDRGTGLPCTPRRFIPACAGNGTPRCSSAASPSVHPRVCGERARRTISKNRSGGSSPRVRGTAAGSRPRSRPHRFIPACAGNGKSGMSRPRSASVHPRVCGERESLSGPPFGCFGSSPRVRGTDSREILERAIPRFIPACAGNGGLPHRGGARSTVHPRVCGERVQVGGQCLGRFGSSPRVRGTVPDRVVAGPVDRFIPACAGNGAVCPKLKTQGAVHPRVCGERILITMPHGRSHGSSPRVRGTVQSHRACALHRRFIPACAGNGRRPRRCRCRPPVHPRVCGERGPPQDVADSGDGSSPRVRGTGRRVLDRRPPRRFIPACAGNGGPASATTRTPSVHPRVCGERLLPTRRTNMTTGSSPRVRGTD